MRLRMTMLHRRSRRRWAHCAASSRAMSVGARAERLLASRLAALERRLDTADEPTADAIWREYYEALDLWLRVRAPVATEPPMTRAMLAERFRTPREGGT